MLAVILIIAVGVARLIGSNANTVFSQVGSGIQWALTEPSSSSGTSELWCTIHLLSSLSPLVGLVRMRKVFFSEPCHRS
jgi:hypothetical protein